MIEKYYYYRIRCDRCGVFYQDKKGVATCYNSMAAAASDALTNRWSKDKERFYCPICNRAMEERHDLSTHR